MPPKKNTNNPDKIKDTDEHKCRGRDTSHLQKYAMDDTLPKGFLANMLKKSGLLEAFESEPDVNECEYSFPGSDWFAVYLKDANGDYFYDNNDNPQTGKFYFQINMINGIPNLDRSSGTFQIPDELKNKSPCTISEVGNCVNPKEPKKTKEPKEPKVKAVKAVKAVNQNVVNIADSVLSPALEALQLDSQPEQSSSSKNTMSREDAEKMDKKTMIDWMSKNMYSKDVLKCIRSGAISKQDTAELDEFEGDISIATNQDEDADAINKAKEIGLKQTEEAVIGLAKEELIKDLSKFSPAIHMDILKSEAATGGAAGYEIGKDYSKEELMNIVAKHRSKPVMSAFGSRNAFGKKCKKTSKYRKCSKTTVRRIYRKSYFGESDSIKAINLFINDVKSKVLSKETLLQFKDVLDLPKLIKNPSTLKTIGPTILAFLSNLFQPLFILHFSAFKDKLDVLRTDITNKMVPIVNDFIGRTTSFVPILHRLEAKAAMFAFLKILPVTKIVNSVVGNIIDKIKDGGDYLISKTIPTTAFGKRKKIIKKSKRRSPKISATSVPIGTSKRGIDHHMWIVKKTKNGVKRWFKK